MTLSSEVVAITSELATAGVRDVVICPGSRSTPLALALEADPRIRTWVHLDERAGAFFALGAAKASRRAVGILSTSGTAAANFLPAVVEASQARVPLLVLTADRPPELQDRGANQTIDQVHLYGRFTRWFAQLPLADGSDGQVAHVRGVVDRAVATTMIAPAGPVHLNMPFREPLVPEIELAPKRSEKEAARPHLDVLRGHRELADDDLVAIAARLATAERPLIVCGPLDEPGFPAEVGRLAASLGAPILADALSNVRLGHHDRSHVIARYDAIARSQRVVDVLIPDVVLRFGATPTSKSLGAMLQAQASAQIIVDDGGWTEPTGSPGRFVQASPRHTAAALADALPARTTRPWIGSWLRLDRAADSAIRERLETLDEPFEGAVFAQLEGALPEGTLLMASNSMPVRDMDAYLTGSETAVRTLGNRGASGIDGVVSTALGMAATGDGPVVLVVGDIAFIHDLNALVALRDERPPLTIVLIDNDGGGIFSFLPQARTRRPEVGLPDAYERLFGTPHGLDLGAIVGAFGLEHAQLEAAAIGAAVAASLATPGVHVLHLRTGRDRNVELHRSISDAAVEALEAAMAT